MTYQEAVDYIEEIPKFTKKHTLEHTREFLRGLGNPEKDQKIIHVAGTNGKGSTCSYLQHILVKDLYVPICVPCWKQMGRRQDFLLLLIW